VTIWRWKQTIKGLSFRKHAPVIRAEPKSKDRRSLAPPMASQFLVAGTLHSDIHSGYRGNGDGSDSREKSNVHW
jgi:hypothetical protein